MEVDASSKLHSEQQNGDTAETPAETSPLLDHRDQDATKAAEQRWNPPPGFIWIEVAIFSNVFLSGFDGTITAATYAVIGSDFNTANTISWITTSYLITSTAFQPLYGRFSDILGRRTCFFTATLTFLLGCLGCGAAPEIISLNLMRALAGLGGGGLITMATIINSDMIPFKQRGMYQAAQNVLHGFGSICGASLGGVIADNIGWRWCFYCQVPVSLFALVVGYLVIKVQPPEKLTDEEANSGNPKPRSQWKRIDLSGATLLVLGLSAQLAAMSMGGNEYPWSDIRIIIFMILSVVILVIFVIVELRTKSIPIMPMSLLKGKLAASNMISNICVGMVAYSFLFIIPLWFQVILRDSPSQAGLRLAIPSLATPIGGLVAGITMSRWGHLSDLVRAGCLFMAIGNGTMASLKYKDSSWKYLVYLFPANFGQGIVYPAILFTHLAAFDHSQHAVSSSAIYLFRSMGWVWGIAASSALIQNILAKRLPSVLSNIHDKDKIIDEIRHSVSILNRLPPTIQTSARHVYFDALRYTFLANTAVAVIALLSAFFARGRDLNRA